MIIFVINNAEKILIFSNRDRSLVHWNDPYVLNVVRGQYMTHSCYHIELDILIRVRYLNN